MLEAKLGLEKSAFDKGLAGAGNQLSSFAGTMQGLGGALAGAGITAFIAKIVEAGDTVGDLSQRFKVSTDDLQRFGAAGELSGTSMEAVAKGLAKIQAAGRSSSYMYDLADAVASAGSENEAFAIASAVLGDKLASQLLPMLEMGSAKMRELGDSAGKMDEETVKSMSKISDQMMIFKKDLVAGAAWILGKAIMPLYKGFQTWATTAGVLINGVGNSFGILVESMQMVMKGDFSGAAKNLANSLGKEIINAKDAWKETVAEIWADPEPAADTTKKQDSEDNPRRGKGGKSESSRGKVATDPSIKGIADRQKKEEQLVEDIAELKKKQAEEQMTLEERIAAKKAEGEAVVNAKFDARRYEDRLALEKKALEIAAEYRDLMKQADEKRKETLDQIAAKEKELAASRMSIEKAQQDMRTAQLDRAASSLGDLAAGSGGIKAQRQARQVQKWESRAARRKAQGDEAGALEALGNADAARQKIAGLSSSDKNPMKGMEDRLKESVEKQGEILDTISELKKGIGA